MLQAPQHAVELLAPLVGMELQVRAAKIKEIQIQN